MHLIGYRFEQLWQICTRLGILGFLFLSTPAPADPDWEMYHREDTFQWSNYDADLHLVGAYAISLTGGLILEHQFHMKRWQAALTMAIVTGMAGTAKEALHDTFCSRTDILEWWVGGAAGGLTMVVFQF